MRITSEGPPWGRPVASGEPLFCDQHTVFSSSAPRHSKEGSETFCVGEGGQWPSSCLRTGFPPTFPVKENIWMEPSVLPAGVNSEERKPASLLILLHRPSPRPSAPQELRSTLWVNSRDLAPSKGAPNSRKPIGTRGSKRAPRRWDSGPASTLTLRNPECLEC